MITLFSCNYLSRKPIDNAMQKFAKRFDRNAKILDIGCGAKPYAQFFKGEYVGVDPFESEKPDIIAPAWNIPVADSSFDAIVLNQSLEHIQHTELTLKEISRILKPGGYCFISVPQAMKNHSPSISIQQTPFAHLASKKMNFDYWQEDYYRFTKYALVSFFKDYEVERIYETSGYFGTMAQLINYFFAALTPYRSIKLIFIPIFLICNLLGKGLDLFFYFLSFVFRNRYYEKFYQLVYLSLPLNYIFITRKP